MPSRREPGKYSPAYHHGVRWPVPHLDPRADGHGYRCRRPASSQLEHGCENYHRLGHDDEQGL